MPWLSCSLLFVVCYMAGTTSSPLSPPADSVGFLKKYGYLRKEFTVNSVDVGVDKELENALKEYQNMMGIQETGVLDQETKKKMVAPRCGNPDLVILPNQSHPKRHKRFSLAGRWREFDKQNFTYCVKNSPHQLTQEETIEEIEKAVLEWERVADIHMERKMYCSGVDIEMKFAPRYHWVLPFDGRGGQLAHAFPPNPNSWLSIMGDIHFDLDEYWVKGCTSSSSGVHLYSVALHEIGHSLGLGHSRVWSIMYPLYTPCNQVSQLQPDDIAGIQSIYGAPVPNVESEKGDTQKTEENEDENTEERQDTEANAEDETNEENGGDETNKEYGADVGDEDEDADSSIDGETGGEPRQPDICLNAALDAITTTARGNTYAFKGDYYFKIENTEKSRVIAKGYPRLIAGGWGNLTGPVDAALDWPPQNNGGPGTTFIFKNDTIWIYKNETFYDRRPVREVFPRLPNNIDAAFTFEAYFYQGQRYYKTFFFKGSLYYRSTVNGGGSIPFRYPASTRIWNLPGGIHVDDVLPASPTGPYSYIFSQGQYYGYINNQLKINRSERALPVGKHWFGCTNSLQLVLDDTAHIKTKSQHSSNGDDSNMFSGFGDETLHTIMDNSNTGNRNLLFELWIEVMLCVLYLIVV